MSTQCRVDSLNALITSLILGTLGVILLLSILGRGTVVSASQEETILSNLTRETLGSPTAPITTIVRITKTVEPTLPDTGGVVSICFSISGLSPRSLDVVLVQDVSESMNLTAMEGETQTRLEASQVAASALVSFLPGTDRTAVVSYSTTAHLAQPLTTTKSAITRTISDLTATGWTNIGDGIRVSHEELITSPRYVSDTVRVIILLSDGVANCDETGFCSNDPDTLERAADYAKIQATLAASDTIKIYTIGFGTDVGEDLLREIADIGGSTYFFAPEGDVLETIYLTIALELHNLIITDILTPGVETDCSQWPDGSCVVDSSGVTTLTVPISDSLLITDPAVFCFPATVNLDPSYEGPINLPGSGICYQDSDGQTICEEFDNPTVTVGGRKITGYVFYDVNGNGLREAEEAGAPSVVIRTVTEMISGTLTLPSDTTDVSGTFVLRTPSAPTISVIIDVPPGYVATIPISEAIPAVTGSYSVPFGIRAVVYLPVVTRDYPLPSIINGDFEDGWTGWKHGGELAQTITSTNPHSGNFSALFGDPTYVCQDGVPVGSAWMEQTFSVPSTNYPRLLFWYNIFTEDRNSGLSDEFDSFDVSINDVLRFRDAKITGTYGCAPQVVKDLGWRIGEIDLRDYREQQITIRFENRNHHDGWYNTWTFVDAVQFKP